MTSLSKHQSNEYTKLLVMGNPGTGKTGALTSLVAAGYKLRIIDLDNGLEVLKQFILNECPDKIDNVEYYTVRDSIKSSAAGPIIDGKPEAFIITTKLLDRWKYDDVDLGDPSEWGPDCILVIDTLTFLSEAALNWRMPLAGADKRMAYYDAQKAILSVLGLINSDSFRTNVIVNSHIQFVDNDDGTRKGFPSSVGSAIAGKIGMYFNSVALCETKGGGTRTLKTTPTAMIDLKNPAPFAMAKEYPIATGLAQFFAVLRDPPKQTKQTNPKIKRVV